MPKQQQKGRGRPPKKPSDRKSEYLRIPVTGAQKEMIGRAVAVTGTDFAAWARGLLLVEAARVLHESR